MASILPSDVFAGYELVAAAGTVTAQSIVIPIASLPALSAGEADELTGDGAQLIRAIDLAIHDAIDALAPNDRPSNIAFDRFEERTGTFSRIRALTKTYQESAPSSAFDLVPEA